MQTLTRSQKRYLKALAHHYKPVVIIGNHGLTPTVTHEISQALDHHELIKIRVNAADRAERATLISSICATTEAEVIQQIGHIATLFRRNLETPSINLPS